MRPRMLAGTLAIWLVAGLAFLFAGAVLTNVHVTRLGSGLGVAAVVGAFNALVWPVVIRIVLPLTVITLGGAVLVLNGGVILLAAEIVPGVSVDRLWAAMATALILTAATMLATAVLSIDSDTRLGHHRRLRAARAAVAGEIGPEPGVLFLEIDGLAYDVPRRDGNAPTLARWVREGSHRLVRWETDWSLQTGACQAGLLHGSNDDMPAFRWWEREHRRAIVTNHPKDAAELERRVSNGRGLLHENGASRANILSGDAVSTLLTMSAVLDVRRGRLGQDYFAYFASPYNLARTALLAHPGIGFALVRTDDEGAVVLGPHGTHWLADGRVEGEAPPAPFGPDAAHHVARTDGFPHCANVMVNSTYWEETDEVAAFEELVGSHGGMGGPQSHPFVLAAAGLAPPGEVIGAEAMHRVFRGWLAGLGHASYAEP